MRCALAVIENGFEIKDTIAGAVVDIDDHATTRRQDVAAENVLFPALGIPVRCIEFHDVIRCVVVDLNAPVKAGRPGQRHLS